MSFPLEHIMRIERQSQRFSTPCGEGEMVWRRWGSGPAIVLLHGGTGSWTHWIRNVLPLAETHAVWVPDMPGYGDSANPPKGSKVEAIAAIVADGIGRLVPARGGVVLVGFSFGGLVAGNLAAAFPERASRLVLVGAGGLGLRDGQKLPLVAWRHLKDEAERTAAHRHNLANLMLWNEASIDALALEVQSVNATLSRINSGPFSRGDVLLEPLSRVTAPIDGIWGSHDATAAGRLAEVGPILRRTDLHATFTIIEEAGHWVNFEQAAAFDAALGQILGRAARTRLRPKSAA